MAPPCPTHSQGEGSLGADPALGFYPGTRWLRKLLQDGLTALNLARRRSWTILIVELPVRHEFRVNT